MSFSRTYPPQTFNSDSTFFDGGFRLADDFIKREHLQNYKSVWLFVNKTKDRIGIRFHQNVAPQSVTLTASGKNTAGKTIWCSYLKMYEPIKKVMEDKDIKNRRFPVREVQSLSDKNEKIEYEIFLSQNQII